ncbi:hypothetical protein KQI84_17260 [bacterium]|nr:hypothetical protein [bacterium]
MKILPGHAALNCRLIVFSLMALCLWLAAPATAAEPPFIATMTVSDARPDGNDNPNAYTNEVDVTVELKFGGYGIPKLVQISEDSDFGSYEQYVFNGETIFDFKIVDKGPRLATIYARAANLAGVSNTTTAEIEYDPIPPKSDLLSPNGSIEQFDPIIDLGFEVGDPTDVRASGVGGVVIIYSKDGEPPQQYNGEFTPGRAGYRAGIPFDTRETGGDGHYEVWSVARDRAGNREEEPSKADIAFDYRRVQGSGTPSLAGIIPSDSDPTGNADPTHFTNNRRIVVHYSLASSEFPKEIQLAIDPEFQTAATYAYASSQMITYDLPSADGVYTLYCRAAGDSGQSNVVTWDIELDRTNPASLVFEPSKDVEQPDPVVPVQYDFTDQKGRGDRASGVSSVVLIYSKDGDAPQQYNGEFTPGSGRASGLINFDTSRVGGSGYFRLWTITRDVAGNWESDPTTPDVSFNFTRTNTTPSDLRGVALYDYTPTDNADPTKYTNNRIVRAYFLVDLENEPDEVQFSEDPSFETGVTSLTYTGQNNTMFALSDVEGVHTLYARARNSAGAGQTVNASIELDRIDPFSAAESPVGLVAQEDPIVPLLYEYTDELRLTKHERASGVQSIKVIYSKDGDAPEQYNGEFTPGRRAAINFDTSQTGGEGVYEVWTLALDNAGNWQNFAPLEPQITFDFRTPTADYWMLH